MRGQAIEDGGVAQAEIGWILGRLVEVELFEVLRGLDVGVVLDLAGAQVARGQGA